MYSMMQQKKLSTNSFYNSLSDFMMLYLSNEHSSVAHVWFWCGSRLVLVQAQRKILCTIDNKDLQDLRSTIMMSNRSFLFSSSALRRRISIKSLIKFSWNLRSIKYSSERKGALKILYLASLIMSSRREMENASLFTRRYLLKKSTTFSKQSSK